MVKRVSLWGVVVVLAGCDAVLGLGDFTFDAASPVTDGGPLPDSSPSPDACAVDLTKECYPCQPETTEQFLNSCVTGAQCLPFDRSRLVSLLVDGGLPPLPPIPDAAPDVVADASGAD